jgi:1-deoxy-D-xylulose-5-phosphate reductoisomerase
MKRLAILGSTGSIGVNTLDIIRQFPERFEVVSLSAGMNTHLLRQQILQFRPKIVSVLNRELAETLKRDLASVPVEIVHGIEGLIRVATTPEVDQVVSALVGAVGLIPTLSAIKTGKTIALANKESLVMGGKIVIEEAKKNQVQILPLDSEHSATHPDSLWRPFSQSPRSKASRGDGPRCPPSSPLGDGEKDHHRLRLSHEQRTRSDRSPLAFRYAR